MACGLVSIIGPVGVGKTTLAEALAARLDARVIHEDYQGNPFLADGYRGDASMALASQLFFINSRFAQLNLAQWDESCLAISDYGFCQDRIFAELKLNDEDMLTYDHLADRLDRYVKQPELVIHLDASVEVLLERIKDRGRDFEADFSADFLESLRQKQFDVFLPIGCEKILIDCNATDIRQPSQLEKLVEKINDIGC